MRRRRRVNRRDEGVTLFPFLAVLICTMGSLIVLLVIVVQQAKASAAEVSQQTQNQRQDLRRRLDELHERKEEFQWRINVLESSRAQTGEQLVDRRRALSHLELEIEELSKQLDRAVAEAKRIAQLESDQVDYEEASRQEAEELRDAIRRAQEDLKLARQDLAARSRSYSIVPYKGAHGTERRPVFIECLNNRIVLQPEGIELTSRDFHEPLTDENPLAAALRAKREYLARTLQSADGKPYPLLVVRPDGAASYAAARAAMKSWDGEFGYELVESDIQLNYPKRDPLLTKALEHTVREARARRRHLQAIAPARFGRQRPATFTASRTGGFVRRGGTSGDGSERASFGSSDGPFPGRGGSPAGSNSSSGPYPPANLADAAPGGYRGNGGDSKREEAMGGHSEGDGFGAAGWGDEQQAGPSGTSGSNAAVRGPYDPPTPAGSEGGYSRGSDQLPMNGPAEPPGGPGGRSSWNSDPTGATRVASAQSRADSDGTTSPTGSASASSVNASKSGSAGASSSQSSNQASSSGIGGLSGGIAPPSAIAQSRGADWGLPESSAGATGITRPIQLLVSQDRLEILPEDRRFERSTRFALKGAMRDEIDQLIPMIWKRMDGWGIAGAGMYWKPILSVQVRPGAEARFQEFTALMKNSGLVVQRKQK